MPDATVIGKVAIKVVPETEDFRSEAQRALDRIEKQLDPIGIKLEVREVDKRKVQAELSALTRRRDVTIAPKIDKLAAAKVASTLAALSGGRSIANIGSDIADWAGQLDKQVPKIAAATLAITNLGSAALTSTANLFSLGASLASTVGAGLALPGIFGGLAIGIGASVAVLKDFNDRLPEVGDKLAALQDRMSNRFWARAEEPIRRFVNDLLPEFSRGIEDTSSALGGFFANLANSASGQFGGQLTGMFDDLNESIDIAGTYTDRFVGILEKLGSVGAGNLPRLATWFGDISTRFDNFLASEGQNGLQEIVDEGIEALKDLGGVISGTGSLLAGLSRAAEASGASTLDTLRRTMQSAADTVNGPTFQNALRNAFAGAREGLDELTDRSGPRFEGFMLRLSDTLSKGLPKAGEAAGDALGAIFGALDQPVVERSLLNFLDDIGEVVDDLAPTLPSVARGLSAVVDTVGAIATNVSAGLAPVLRAVGDSLPGLARDFDPLISELGELVETGGELAAAVLPEVADILGDVAGSLADALGPLNDLLGLFEQLPNPVQSVGSELAAIGAIVAAGAWLGGAARAKLATMSTGLLTMATNAKVGQTALLNTAAATETASTRMSRASGAIAAGAFALGSIAKQASGGNEAVSALADTLSGVAIGFAVGGPIGAAVGGLATVIGKIAVNSTSARNKAVEAYREIAKIDPVDEAKKSLEDLASTLDQVTGAYTGATRAAVLHKLEEAGLVETAAKYGISARSIVNAALGQKGAMEGLAPVIADVEAQIAALDQAQRDIATNSDNFTDTGLSTDAQEQINALEKQKKALEQNLAELEQMPGALREMGKETRETAAITADYAGKLKGIPHDAKTDIKANGLEPTAEAIAALAVKYDSLDKKDVNTLIQATGADTSVRQVQNLIDTIGNLKDKTVVITTIQRTIRRAANQLGNATTGLLGGGDASDRRVNERGGQSAAAAFSEAFAKTLTQLQNKISNAYEKLLDKVGKKGAKAVKDAFAGELARLNELARSHQRLMRQLDEARSVLEGYKAQWQAMHDSVRDTIIGQSDITQLGAKTYNGLIRALTKARDKAQQFATAVQQLVAAGLNNTTLQQILNAGPDAGLAIAQQILAGGIDQVNQIQAQIDAAAEAAGTAAGQHFFGDLVSQARDDVDKLIDQLGPLQVRLRKFAKDLIESLATALKKEWSQQMGDGGASDPTWKPAGGGKNNKAASMSAKLASGGSGTYVASQKVVHYYAAPGKSISSEEELYEALGKAD